jgi:SAM-dependent methyltransferase
MVAPLARRKRNVTGDLSMALGGRNGVLPRDRHRLYQLAVQSPEADVRFMNRVYRGLRDRPAQTLKEDFCGTAALAAEWVRSRRKNRAIGVDLDRRALDWGRKNNVAPLGDGSSRIRLIQADVRAVRSPKVDVIAAMNFSYFVFKTRPELLDYFSNARASLAPGGVLVLDIFGGWEAQALETERKPLKGFTYVWEQTRFDPITSETLFHIHFRFKDGRWMRRAFTYDWRFWTIPEVRELLRDAGFSRTEVYWEGTETGTGEGNGVFRRTERIQNCPGWIAYLSATS